MIEVALRVLLAVVGLGHLLAVVWFNQYISILLAIPALTVLVLAFSTEKMRRHPGLALLCVLSTAIVAWGLVDTPWTEDYAPRVFAFVAEGVLFVTVLWREFLERVRSWL